LPDSLILAYKNLGPPQKKDEGGYTVDADNFVGLVYEKCAVLAVFPEM
jgi:hypothetical protein